MKHPLLNFIPAKRTDADIIRHMERSLMSPKPPVSIKRSSALINLPRINIKSSFVPDRMHFLKKGLGERFSTSWDS